MKLNPTVLPRRECQVPRVTMVGASVQIQWVANSSWSCSGGKIFGRRWVFSEESHLLSNVGVRNPKVGARVCFYLFYN